jgi:hypothetical protein
MIAMVGDWRAKSQTRDGSQSVPDGSFNIPADFAKANSLGKLAQTLVSLSGAKNLAICKLIFAALGMANYLI